MFVLNENSRPKKRSRDFLDSVSPHSRNEIEHTAKRKRTEEDEYTGHWPPGFWDSLSKVHLTRGALREFKRRISQERTCGAQCPPATDTVLIASTESKPHLLKRFSRRGGPDLTHIRGVGTHRFLKLLYVVPLTSLQFAISRHRTRSMSQSNSSRKRSSAGLSGSGRSDSTRTSKGSYDPNFKQNMIDGGIYPEGHDPVNADEARNLGAIRGALAIPRASLPISILGGRLPRVQEGQFNCSERNPGNDPCFHTHRRRGKTQILLRWTKPPLQSPGAFGPTSTSTYS